jgi:ligand-binding SRPBCC domain-containing protein
VRFERRFRVGAPPLAVIDFHRRKVSLAALTPPLFRMRIDDGPELLADGDRVAFTLWIGPLPVRWVAQIEEMNEDGFTDRQVQGPFGAWRHRHGFEAAGARATWVVDRIEARVAPHPLWGPFGLLMWIALPLLFAYRRARTRRLLER